MMSGMPGISFSGWLIRPMVFDCRHGVVGNFLVAELTTGIGAPEVAGGRRRSGAESAAADRKPFAIRAVDPRQHLAGRCNHLAQRTEFFKLCGGGGVSAHISENGVRLTFP